MASSPAPEDYDLWLPPVDGTKGAAREQKAVYVRPCPSAGTAARCTLWLRKRCSLVHQQTPHAVVTARCTGYTGTEGSIPLPTLFFTCKRSVSRCLRDSRERQGGVAPVNAVPGVCVSQMLVTADRPACAAAAEAAGGEDRRGREPGGAGHLPGAGEDDDLPLGRPRHQRAGGGFCRHTWHHWPLPFTLSLPANRRVRALDTRFAASRVRILASMHQQLDSTVH